MPYDASLHYVDSDSAHVTTKTTKNLVYKVDPMISGVDGSRVFL